MSEEQVAAQEREIAALKEEVARLSQQASRTGSPRAGSPRAFSSFPAGVPARSPRPGSPRSPSPRGARPRSASPRGRPQSPSSPSAVAFGSTVRKVTPNDFFHASMRGGPLTEPLPQRGLVEREKLLMGTKKLQGPSLLTRKKYGAKPSEWDRFKPENMEEGGNMLEDDNPFNDPFKYHPFKGMAFPPTDYIGPDDIRETDDMSTLRPANALRLRFVHGYTTRKGCRANLFYNANGHMVYHAAALGIVYDKATHEQMFFHGHDDDITALDLSPRDRLTVVTGQLGKDPKIIVWSSQPSGNSRHLPQLCLIHGDHKRSIIGLSFSPNGQFIASMGYDNNRSIAIYQWGKDKPLEKMRIGFDKGHSDDVYQLCYNPVTDHVVAGGKKFLRFFGLKEGALSNPEADARAAAKAGGSHTPALAENESKIWAKKGTFGADLGAQDVMALAFDDEGVTYAGSSLGYIFRFAEQATDLMVQAHPQPDSGYDPKNLCRVTALWFNPHTKVLISSGDDGWLHQWNPKAWGASGNKPLASYDLNKYVISELKGNIVKMDDKELDKPNPVRGRPAAAHSLCGDEKGNVLVGTVANEIYEFQFGGGDPMCYVQGHYDEMWGLAMHPTKNECATGAEDETLRLWNLESRSFMTMQKLPGPVRCAGYSPDGKWIAVGLGGKFTGHKATGKWLVLDSATLEVKFEPPHTRFERAAETKFSPDGRYIAVGNGDNGIDVYAVPGSGGHGDDGSGFRKVCKFEGHSSFINHLDWSEDSKKIQTNCGAHELLYWKLYDDHNRWRPHQEKSSSSMRDEPWSTQTCIYGWHVRGLWPEGADGTDINACARSNTELREMIATSDDFGKVKLFRYPCIIPNADNRPYGGHSSHVTNVAFSPDDRWLVSTGGEDRAVFQWECMIEK